MTRIIALGTAAALPDPGRENTYLVLQGEHEAMLIDCAGRPMQNLSQAGIPLDHLHGIILTHHHPDHIYGMPSLLLGLWLSGRQNPFHIYAPPRTLHVAQGMMDLLEWNNWPSRPPFSFHEIPLTPGTLVYDGPEYTITASPGKHMLPNVSLRIEGKATGGILTYCCDTEPTPVTTALATGADILIHDSTGLEPGHSSPQQVGTVAAEAGVSRLIMIHYSLLQKDPETMLYEAASAFKGQVELAQDGDVFTF